jgi:DNA ligase 1
MSQNIANFFRPKPAAGCSGEVPKKEKSTDKAEIAGDPVDGKPEMSERSPVKKSDDSTPPTSRKRIRQADSDASDTDDCVKPKKEDDASIPEADGHKVDDSSKKMLKNPSDESSNTRKEEKSPKTQDSTVKSIEESSETKSSKNETKTVQKVIPKGAAGKSTAEKHGGASKKDDDEGQNTDEEEDDDDSTCHEAVLKTVLDFDVKKDSTWKPNDPVPYSHLATAFEKIEATSKRLEITAILTKALRCIIELSPSDLLPTIYLCVNKLAPAHEGVELGLGDMVLTKALAEATGRQEKDIKAEYEKVRSIAMFVRY